MSQHPVYQFFDSLELFGIRLGLAQIERLLALLGNPHENLRFIHVAGSNGKGSVCAMVEAGLRAAGFHTGFYSSPHLVSVCERFRIDGKIIPESLLELYGDRILSAAEQLKAEDIHVTYFEVMTALAAMIFADAHVDFVLWEVGMGGRLDATNVITPVASAITGISLEHTQYLGDTIEKIAFEKAGIIKNGVPVFCSIGTPEEAQKVIRRRAAECNAPFILPEKPSAPSQVSLTNDGHGVEQLFEVQGHPLSLHLAGPHQRINASLACSVLAYLADKFHFSFETALSGVSKTLWPGRFDLLPELGLVLDSAHNPEGADVLAATLREVFPGRKFRFFFGAFSDKDTWNDLKILAPLATSFVFLQPDSARPGKSTQALQKQLAEVAPDLPSSHASLEEVLTRLSAEIPTVLCGSLHLCGDVLARLQVQVR